MPRRKNKTGRVIFGGAVLASLAVGGWFAWPYVYQWAVPAKDVKDVLTAKVERGDMEIPVTDRGELESTNAVTVNCELEGGGKLVSIVPEGTFVKKGEEVGRIDTDALMKLKSEQEVKVEQAEGKLKASRSDLDVQINKGATEVATAQLALDLAKIDFDTYLTGKYKVDYDTKKGALELARKDLKEAESNLDYTKELVRKGQGQMEQVRIKELDVQQKKFALDQNSGALALLENVTKKRDLLELEAKATNARRDRERAQQSADAATEKARGDLRASEKTLEIEKSTLKRIEDQVSRCQIKAPSDGIVIYFRRGWWDDESRIRPGVTLYFQQQIFSLPDLSKMQVKVKVHESMVKRVQKGLPCRMQVEALPGKILHGTVMTVGSVASSDGFRGGGVKEYEVVASIDDLPADSGLKPGMTAETKVILKRLTGVLQIPLQTVTEFDGKHVVYVVNGKDITRREVEIGDRNDTMIQIPSGVDEGEVLALDARTRSAADAKTLEKKPGSKKGDSETKETQPASEAKASPGAAGGS
jgi:RND family efflux transporter MFP subunit